MKNRVVVLFSGGIDSTVVLAMQIRELGNKGEFHTLSIDYGQRNRQELEAARRVVAFYKEMGVNITHHETKVSFPWKGSALLDSTLPMERNRTHKQMRGSLFTSIYIPARNMVFLSLAASLAETIKADKIFTGFVNGLPDQSASFVGTFNDVIRTGTKCATSKRMRLSVHAPIVNVVGKSKIINKGFKLSAPLHLTWTCHDQGTKPCGSCDACRKRERSFGFAGKPDPAQHV